MKVIKINSAWSFTDYQSIDGRFLFKNIYRQYLINGINGEGWYLLPKSKCGFELYVNNEKIGFFKTLKAAKNFAEESII